MLAPRPLALVIAAAAATALVGCAGGGGGGGGSVSSASGTSGGGSSVGSSVTSPTGPTPSTFTGVDTTPPDFALVSPARAGFVSGLAATNLEGTATDAHSGVQAVEVNGQPASISGASWTIPATLVPGVNTFTIHVTDNQGNESHTSWSAIYSPAFLPANLMVRESAALRLSEKAVDQLVPLAVQSVVQSGMIASALSSGASIGTIGTIQSVTFDPPTVEVDLVQGGVDLEIDVPNLDAQVTLSGSPMHIEADLLEIDATLLVSASNGVFAVSMPSPPTLTFTNPVVNGSSALGAGLATVFQSVIGPQLQTLIAGAVQNALNGVAIAPRSFTYGPITATVEARPNALAISATQGVANSGMLRASGDANISIAASGILAGAPHSNPGSFSRGGALGAAPLFMTQHDVSLAIREDLVNRAIYAAWQSGAARVRIDQTFVNQALAQLPFPIPFQVTLDISFLVPFFPALASINPGGGAMPIAFELDPALPPVVTVQGAPSLLQASVGELQLKLLVDVGQGQGFQDMLVLALHGTMGASAQIQGASPNMQLKVAIQPPVQLNATLLQNPFGLNAPDVDRFINTALPFVVQLAGGLIPPVSLPAIPGGLSPTNLDIFQDGQDGDFFTIEGDL